MSIVRMFYIHGFTTNTNFTYYFSYIGLYSKAVQLDSSNMKLRSKYATAISQPILSKVSIIPFRTPPWQRSAPPQSTRTSSVRSGMQCMERGTTDIARNRMSQRNLWRLQALIAQVRRLTTCSTRVNRSTYRAEQWHYPTRQRVRWLCRGSRASF